jgi:2-polyprenyl-3-methyl-5-hydroxy-6-metoxy-1,4-benzoquinol methylase
MRTTKLEFFKDGKDRGFIGKDRQWWFNPAFRHAFHIFDVNTMYGEEQVKRGIEKEFVEKYVDIVMDWGKRFVGHDIHSILELGCGTGWITREFVKRGVNITAVEGSIHAAKVAMDIKGAEIICQDLRYPLSLSGKYDITVCTEVAEHLECPFSATLVGNMTRHSDVVWFSSDGKSMAEAHYAHMNEQPIQFWHHLFRFFGYKMYFLPHDVQHFWKDSEGTRAVFYSEKLDPRKFDQSIVEQPDLPDTTDSVGYAII